MDSRVAVPSRWLHERETRCTPLRKPTFQISGRHGHGINPGRRPSGRPTATWHANVLSASLSLYRLVPSVSHVQVHATRPAHSYRAFQKPVEALTETP